MDGEITVGEWAERWLASRVDLKPRTLQSYEGILRARVLPAFADRTMASLRPMELQEWLASMQREGVSASRCRHCAHILSAVLESAADEGLIARNPATRLRLPRLPDTEIQFLTAQEVERGARRC